MGISLKRAFDVVGAATGLLASAPVIAGVGFLMHASHGSGVFFEQERIGKDGKPFTILKIKTMRDAFDAAGKPLPDNQRTSRLGILIRKSRLDELPQLINVFCGDMSLVGPRPMLKSQPLTLDPVRTKVRPGITGIAQIRALNNLSYSQQLLLDQEYVTRLLDMSALQQAWYDVSIMARTPFSIFRNWSVPHATPQRPSL